MGGGEGMEEGGRRGEEVKERRWVESEGGGAPFYQKHLYGVPGLERNFFKFLKFRKRHSPRDMLFGLKNPIIWTPLYLPQKTKQLKIRSRYDLLMWPVNLWTAFKRQHRASGQFRMTQCYLRENTVLELVARLLLIK
jgi:hypothetical protein